MLKLYTKKNIPVDVPENINEDSTPRFALKDIKNAKKYYSENGYVIFSNFVPPEACDKIRNLWNDEVKNFKGKLYRQTTGKAERNKFNKNRWIMNPILNIQSLNNNSFKNFKKAVEDSIFNNFSISSALQSIFSEKPKIIQSMYFEGNSVTGEHQDTYYLDSNKIGILTAAWIALEEIKADAGRFFIFSGSHKIDIKKLRYYNQILSNHDLYTNEIIEKCVENNYLIKAPYLNKGDVLFWNSKTLHGSLNSFSENKSRSSITFHAIPNNHKFLHWHKYYINTPYDDLGRTNIYRRKDQNLLKNRLILYFETIFPNFFYFLKKNISKYLFNQKHY